jgi:hypothetical protein
VIIPEAYHPNHPMGDSTCIVIDPPVNYISGLVYVHVPKNASCWVKHHLCQTQSIFYNYYHQGFDVEKNLALVILRDPIERWISAMGQILVGYNTPGHPLHIDKLNWDQITTKIFRNNHTQPQHEFFANIPQDRIVWFYCNRSLKDKFQHFLTQYRVNITWLPENQDLDNKFNITKKVPEKIINDYLAPAQQIIVDKIKKVLEYHPEYIERIKNLYQEDYNLINSVPYYDPR